VNDDDDDDDDCGSVGVMSGRGNRSAQIELAPVALCLL
jgi:hypothetical protein